MKEMQISDELDKRLQELADRITAETGKKTTAEEALEIVTVPLSAFITPEELSPEHMQKLRDIINENKELAQKTLEEVILGCIRDYVDFLDSKKNPPKPKTAKHLKPKNQKGEEPQSGNK